MKKFLVLLLLVLLLCSCGKKKEESEYKVGTSNKIKDELAFKVKIEKINIREEPNTQSDILGVVEEGSKFIIIDYTSDETFIWFHIKTKNKIEGYVASGRENPYVEILNGEVDIDPPVLRLLETNIKVKTHKEVTVDNFKNKYIEVSDNLGDVEVELKPDYQTSAGSHRYVIDIEATDKAGNKTSKRAYLEISEEQLLSNGQWATYNDVKNIRKKFQNVCTKYASYLDSSCYNGSHWNLSSNGNFTIWSKDGFCEYTYKKDVENGNCYDGYSTVNHDTYNETIKPYEDKYLPTIKKIINEYIETGYSFEDMYWQ